MEINTSKTKEMVLGRLANTNLTLPNIASQTVERVTTYKLLGVHIDSTLSTLNISSKRQPQGYIS